MLMMGAFLSFFYTDALSHYFAHYNHLYPSEIWNFLFSFSVFILYGCFLAIYFRLVFGFFSRLFERQADLHIFNYSLSPSYMIQALDHIGVVTGNTHDHPSWHHYSIQERMDFLQSAIQNPRLITQHHRKVKKWVIIYFILLILSCLSLFFS
jgi:Zn-dependent protease with chaperone function